METTAVAPINPSSDNNWCQTGFGVEASWQIKPSKFVVLIFCCICNFSVTATEPNNEILKHWHDICCHWQHDDVKSFVVVLDVPLMSSVQEFCKEESHLNVDMTSYMDKP